MTFRNTLIQIALIAAFAIANDSTWVDNGDSSTINDSIIIDDSINWNDTTVTDDSTNWNDTNNWNDTIIIDDSTNWNDTNTWNDTIIIDDSTNWNDSNTWNDTIIIDDSTNWNDSNYLDDSLSFYYDSINSVGLKLFWQESTDVIIEDIDIIVNDSTWDNNWFNETVIKNIKVDISTKNNGTLDSAWISVNYGTLNSRSLIDLVYQDPNSGEWKSATNVIITNSVISGFISSASRVAVVQKDNNTPISGNSNLRNNASNFSVTTNGINFTLGKSANVKVELFNVAGQNVATLFSGNKNIGSHNINTNKLNTLAAGNYILTLKVNGKISKSKLFKIGK